MTALYKHYVYFGKFPHEIMALSENERSMVNAFLQYAMEEGDIGIKIRNMSTKKPTNQ